MKAILAHRLLTLARIAFFALVVLIPLRARILLVRRPVGTIYGDYTDFLLFATDILLMTVLAAWLVGKTLTRTPFRWPSAALGLPLVGFTLWAVLNPVGAIDWPLAAYHTLRVSLLAGMVLYMADQLTSVSELVLPVSVQVALQAVIGIGQFFRQSDLGLQRLGEYALQPDWAGVSIVFDHQQRWLRAYGLSDHPNILGGCLAFGLLFLLGSLMQPGRAHPRQHLLTGLSFVAGSLALFYTFSRAAWLAVVVGALMLLITQRQQTNLRLALIWLAITAGLLAPLGMAQSGLIFTRLHPPQQPGLSPTELQARGERVLLNQASLDVFLQHPIRGSGLGSLPQAIRNSNPDFGPYYQPAHIVLLAAAAETGLLGVTLYFLLLASPLLTLLASRRVRANPAAGWVACGLLAVGVVGLFDYYPWLLQPGRLWQYLLWGAWAVSLRRQAELETEHG